MKSTPASEPVFPLIAVTSHVIFSGQHNDARMNLALGLTAVRHGASVANHVEVLSLLKEKGTSLYSYMW